MVSFVKDRLLRLKVIRRIIKNYRIQSQDELSGYLQKENFAVTQATLSRDLKMLKVGKVSDGHNGYIYSLPEDDDRPDSDQVFIQDFLRGYISVECSGNIAVIKTYPGYATVVAGAVDSLCLDEVLGTIAGCDNCVFACLREGVSSADFLSILKLKIPELDD